MLYFCVCKYFEKVTKLVTYRRYQIGESEYGFVVWGPSVVYWCDMSLVPDKKAEKRWEAFLPNFQESLFLAWNYNFGNNFVPNVLKASFVSYLVNEI